MTPTPSRQLQWESVPPAGRAQQLIAQLVKWEETIRKSPLSIHTNRSCFSQDMQDPQQTWHEGAGQLLWMADPHVAVFT